MVFRLHTLKKRAQFVRARNGRYFAAPGLILQAIPVRAADHEPDPAPSASTSKDKYDPCARFGFTATKKLGNAVVRNRTKRRLREAVRLIAPQAARTDTEYVLIGRKSTLKRPFSALLHDLTIAFGKVHAKRVDGNNEQHRARPAKRKAGRRRSQKH